MIVTMPSVRVFLGRARGNRRSPKGRHLRCFLVTTLTSPHRRLRIGGVGGGSGPPTTHKGSCLGRRDRRLAASPTLPVPVYNA